MTESRYLSFEVDDHYEGKTERVFVCSKQTTEIIGVIKWFGRWRQYAFFPAPDTAWNPECLRNVNGEIERLMLERKGGENG